MDKELTIKEYAVKYHHSERKIRQMCIDGLMPDAHRLPGGRKWLIPDHESKDSQDEQAELIRKAKDEHLSDIRKLLLELKDDVATPSIEKAYPNCLRSIEKHTNLSTDSFERHVPIPEFWRKLTLWTSKMHDYLESCEDTISHILHDERVIKLIADNPGHRKTDYLDPILDCIRDRQLGKTLDQLYTRNPNTGGLETFVLEVSKFDAHNNVGKIPIKDRASELDSIERSIVVNPEICFYFARSKETANLVKLFKELKLLEGEIQDYLRKILWRREYVRYKCSLCPGEQSTLFELKSKY